jgi:hypothetical protein
MRSQRVTRQAEYDIQTGLRTCSGGPILPGQMPITLRPGYASGSAVTR